MKINFKDPRIKFGTIGAVAVILAGLLLAHRGGMGAGSVTGQPFTARFISGDGKRQASAAADFLSMVIPTDVAEQDLLMFSEAANDNVLSLPEKATLRFPGGGSATINRLEKLGERYEVAVDLVTGRIWVNAPQSYDVTITAKSARVVSNPGAVFEVILARDENYYDVATVRVFNGSVTLGGRTEKSDREVVNAGEAGRVNEDKLFKPEPFASAKADQWETWNLSWTDDSDLTRASSQSQSAPMRNAPGPGANPPSQRPEDHRPAAPGSMPPAPRQPVPPAMSRNQPRPGTPPPQPQVGIQPPVAPQQAPTQFPPQQASARFPSPQPGGGAPGSAPANANPAGPPPVPAASPPVYAPNASPLAPGSTPQNGVGQPPPPAGGGNNSAKTNNPPPGGGQPAPGLPATVMPDTAPRGY